ncbi:MAG: hypothetical protein AAF698_11775 [Pseudomonadota bacterium]
MSRLQQALSRLEQAVVAVEAAGARAAAEAEVRGNAGMVDDERAALMARIEELEAQTREDAMLRAEAADAVKAALSDLRAVQDKTAAAE